MSDPRGAQWRKSTYSTDAGNCVEVASNLLGRRALRDSKVTDGPVLVFSSSEWSVFLGEVKAGRL
ncbi:DUF397 domain-containing protein [Sphaerisporangium sp. NPDC005288]|uniref:DUF397 domain-containing protein n=1 Tax=Sphaerisporangium sp. NPDC005288 TaxID=3155114 RepID=UPI0033AEF541